jgi:ABC-type uncharacterized transport system permease subunit
VPSGARKVWGKARGAHPGSGTLGRTTTRGSAPQEAPRGREPFLSILLHALVAALYAVAAWLCRPRPDGVRLRASRVGAIALALAVHAVVIARAIVTPQGLDLSFVNALSLVAGLAVLIAWLSGALAILPGVATMILPVAALCALLPAASPSAYRFPYTDAPFAAAHIAVSLVAYALFVVAALQALVLVRLEKRLHRGAPSSAEASTPPLLTLERYLFGLIGIGFLLLTVSLISGMIFSEEVFGQPAAFTHKVVLTVAGWATFAVLLFGRWRYGWRGRTALKWILAGTVLLLLGYLGSKFVMEVLLHRGLGARS